MAGEMEEVCLHGGPGDGTTVKCSSEHNLLRWKPTDDREKIAARMHGHSDIDRHPVLYCRSRCTRKLFVYQP